MRASSKPPFLRGLVSWHRAGLRAHPLTGGITVAGQRRPLTGFAGTCTTPAPTRAPTTLPRPSQSRHPAASPRQPRAGIYGAGETPPDPGSAAEGQGRHREPTALRPRDAVVGPGRISA